MSAVGPGMEPSRAQDLPLLPSLCRTWRKHSSPSALPGYSLDTALRKDGAHLTVTPMHVCSAVSDSL